MIANPRILLIEDDRRLADNLRPVLEGDGFAVTHLTRGDEGLQRAINEEFHVILTDLRIPGLGGLDLVRQLHEARPRLPVVLMTAHGTMDTAIEATRLGAYDYLQKPFEMEELLSLLQNAVESGRLMGESVSLDDTANTRSALVGTSRAMQQVCKEIGRVAARPVTVLVRGETGTGKELIARAIYQHSPRANAPFIAINCGAIPENLLESELFGHERGAFTGAERRRIGRFEQAHRGTLFLDEIGDLPAHTQVKLLRVLEQQSFQRLGGTETITTDVRIIAATHRDLETMIREGRFREDLLHRLNVVTIFLPPLRERREDIPSLMQHFLRKYAADFGSTIPSLAPEALALLQSAPWPGNIRQLENVTRRILLDSRGLAVTREAAERALAVTGAERHPSSLSSLAGALLARAQRGEITDACDRLLAEAEKELITQAILLAEGNQAKAARWLGLSRLTLREKLTRLGLRAPSQE